MLKKIGIFIFLFGIAAILFAGFVPNTPADPSSAAIEELKNQVAGLSARVSTLEKQVDKLTNPKSGGKSNFVPAK